MLQLIASESHGRLTWREVEETMTLGQIRLHYHWAMRAEKRRMRLTEHAVLLGTVRAFNGDPT